MKLFITQPTYLSWLGIFYAINWADTFVFYDDVQYERKSWQNRNRIRNLSTGNETLLTVPVRNQPRETLIKDIEISNPLFFEKHLKTIELNYSKEPYTKGVLALLELVYKWHTHLSELNIDLIKNIASYLGLKTNFTRSSDYHIEGTKFDRPVKLAKALGATDYLTQLGTKDYITQEAFGDIKLHWLDIEPPSYLSIVDYLCRFSPEEIRRLL